MRMCLSIVLCSIVLGAPTIASASETDIPRSVVDSRISSAEWLSQERQLSIEKIINSITRQDTEPGVVIASPSKTSPNYYFHWVRDAALTMDLVVSLYIQEADPRNKQFWQQRIVDYLNFSQSNQNAQSISGLGEPKFYVDGRPFSDPWGRPQNDGPALRAIAVIRFAQELIKKGDEAFVRKFLYDSCWPSSSLIKRDLEYVSHVWTEPSYDLWEEVLGDHFYTLMTQRKALLLGATFANQLGDSGAAQWYMRQAHAIERYLKNFWSEDKGYVVATLNWRQGVDYKHSNLDVAVVLGALHGGMNDGFFDFSDHRIQKTMHRLEGEFKNLYKINYWRGFPGIAIGRYPEDRYDGGNFEGGNPWVLATLAFAEGYYKMAATFGRSDYIATGDKFLDRVQLHANPDGTLAEQIDRRTGYMTSAENLTWNYSAIITTFESRNALTGPHR